MARVVLVLNANLGSVAREELLTIESEEQGSFIIRRSGLKAVLSFQLSFLLLLQPKFFLKRNWSNKKEESERKKEG